MGRATELSIVHSWKPNSLIWKLKLHLIFSQIVPYFNISIAQQFHVNLICRPIISNNVSDANWSLEFTGFPFFSTRDLEFAGCPFFSTRDLEFWLEAHPGPGDKVLEHLQNPHTPWEGCCCHSHVFYEGSDRRLSHARLGQRASSIPWQGPNRITEMVQPVGIPLSSLCHSDVVKPEITFLVV